MADTDRHYILATAGHVDHGKSALVRALTGTDPDRLPEEKARGITIDLGFAHLTVPSPPGVAPTAAYHVGVVDVPGHEDFVRNMVAGVGSIDAALLVVAADDGWMPQTEEHFQILTYLGLSAGVVALSKVDMVGDEAAAVAAVRERLRGSPLEDAPIVPTSTATGHGVQRLRDELARVLYRIAPQPDYGKPRLPVDRVFSLKGIGTVVTGTLAGGTIRRGEEVVVYPVGARTRVRSVQSHNREVDVGRPGSRVALNLPGVQPWIDRTTRAADGVRRGDVVTMGGMGLPARHAYVVLTRSPRLAGTGTRAPSLRHGMQVRFHHTTTAVAARLRLVGVEQLGPGERCLAHVTLEEPAYAFVGDRFVLRDWSGRNTLAGGTVLDADAPAKASGVRQQSRFASLKERDRNVLDPVALVSTQLAWDHLVDARTFLAKACVDRRGVETALADLVKVGSAVVAGDWVVSATLWSMLHETAVAAVDRHHREHPEQVGLPVANLRAALKAHLKGRSDDATGAVQETLVSYLGRDGFVCTGTAVRRLGHRPALPPRLQGYGQEIRRRLGERPFDPPSRKELCRTDLAQQAMRFLIASGEAVDLGPDVALSADAYAEAVERIRAHLRARGTATVSELKGVLSSSRRVMVPLLERLDRDGVTRREGDLRRLR